MYFPWQTAPLTKTEISSLLVATTERARSGIRNRATWFTRWRDIRMRCIVWRSTCHTVIRLSRGPSTKLPSCGALKHQNFWVLMLAMRVKLLLFRSTLKGTLWLLGRWTLRRGCGTSRQGSCIRCWGGMRDSWCPCTLIRRETRFWRGRSTRQPSYFISLTQIWDARNGEMIHRLQGHQGEISCSQF